MASGSDQTDENNRENDKKILMSYTNPSEENNTDDTNGSDFKYNGGPKVNINAYLQQNVAGGNIVTNHINNAKEVNFGNKINIYQGNFRRKETNRRWDAPPLSLMPKKMQVPKEILTSQEIVTEEIMLVVKNGNIGSKWKEFGQLLRLTEGTLKKLEIEHRCNGINQIVFQIMNKWIEQTKEKASIGKLAAVLEEIGRGDLASSLLNNSS